MSTFERKTLNGEPNPKYIDLCDEDAPIAGQKFACMSFVSPEKILKQREMFNFEKFVEQWEYTKIVTKTSDFINFFSYKNNLKVDDVLQDFQEFVKEEKESLKQSSFADDFKTYIEQNEDQLNTEFQKANEFKTSVRGLKIRGVFQTQEEAEMKCKKLREIDPHHDIYVGPIGMWIPWDPDAYKTGRVEFMEDELNQLHHEKLKNETKAKEEFDKRVLETKRKAIEENIKKAKESGNTLTQTIDESGNLIGVKETVDFDSREVATEEGIKEHNEKIVENANKKSDA
jgi:hypothetical protein